MGVVVEEEDDVAVPLFSREEGNGYWDNWKAGEAQGCDWRKVLWMDIILLRVSGRGHVDLAQLECMGEMICRLELQLRQLSSADVLERQWGCQCDGVLQRSRRLQRVGVHLGWRTCARVIMGERDCWWRRPKNKSWFCWRSERNGQRDVSREEQPAPMRREV